MYSVAYLTFLKKGTRKFANYKNILAVEVLMKEEDSVFNERQSVDLTPYLRGFDGDEISLELDLHIGRELEIGGPVIIPDWEDTPETEFP